MSDQRSKIGYRPDIDGLRALAVLGVMAYHAGFGLSGGFVGVDVFFVISGFLITQGMLHELESGQFSVQRFWERRIRRILPASLVTIAAVLVAGYCLLFPTDYAKCAQAAIAQLFFCGNIFYWRDTGYFAGAAELKPLLHTWSLAVEEQFYLGLPLILSLLFRCGRKVALACLLAVAIGSFIACASLTPVMPSASFYLLPTRAWELLAGSLIAFRRTQPARVQPGSWKQQGLAIGALAGLIGAMGSIESGAKFPGYLAAIPVVCTAVLIDVHRTRTTGASRLLSHPWLVGIGLISYSLYLWHWPLLAFTRYLFASAPADLLFLPFLAAFPIAYASWKWIECPFRRRVDWRGTRLYACAGAALLVPLIASAFIWSQKGIPQRIDAGGSQLPPPVESLSQRYRTSPVDFTLEELPLLGDRNAPPSFLVWGDSHALALAPVIDEIASEFGQAGRLVARGGTPPQADGWRADADPADRASSLRWNANVLHAINSREWKGIIVVAGWQIYLEETGLRDAQSEARSAEPAADVLRRQLSKMADRMDTSANVFWLAPAPRQTTDLAQAVRNRALHAWSPEPGAGLTREKYQAQIADIAEAFQTLEDAQHRWLDTCTRMFDTDGEAILFHAGEFCYVDDNHVSIAGARLYFGECIRGIMQSLTEPRGGER